MGPHHTGTQETALASRVATHSLCNSATDVSCSTQTGTGAGMLAVVICHLIIDVYTITINKTTSFSWPTSIYT